MPPSFAHLRLAVPMCPLGVDRRCARCPLFADAVVTERDEPARRRQLDTEEQAGGARAWLDTTATAGRARASDDLAPPLLLRRLHVAFRRLTLPCSRHRSYTLIGQLFSLGASVE